MHFKNRKQNKTKGFVKVIIAEKSVQNDYMQASRLLQIIQNKHKCTTNVAMSNCKTLLYGI